MMGNNSPWKELLAFDGYIAIPTLIFVWDSPFNIGVNSCNINRNRTIRWIRLVSDYDEIPTKYKRYVTTIPWRGKHRRRWRAWWRPSTPRRSSWDSSQSCPSGPHGTSCNSNDVLKGLTRKQSCTSRRTPPAFAIIYFRYNLLYNNNCVLHGLRDWGNLSNNNYGFQGLM